MALPGIARPKRRGPAPLAQQAAELEQLATQYGASPEGGLASQGPVSRFFHSPIVRTVVDLISRGEYAAAGAAEELLTARGGGAGAAVSRALREVFSGVAGVAGDKEIFTQVLEQSGWGTVTVADAVPALEGTWVGNFGSRGAAGLALGVAFDPLTWLSGGTSAAAKTVFKDGTRFLTKAARVELGATTATLRRGKYANEFKAALDAEDAIKLKGIETKIENEAQEAFLAKYADNDGVLPSRLTDPGGLKFAGRSIIPGRAFTELNASTAAMFTALPGGKAVMENTLAFHDTLASATSKLLSPFHALREFRKDARYDYAIKLHRSTVHARAAVEGRLRSVLLNGHEKLGIAPEMRQRWIREIKKDALLGNKIYSILDNAVDPATGRRWALSDLPPEQAALAREWGALAETTRATLVDHGIFTQAELARARLPHTYTNLDELAHSHVTAPTKLDERVASDFFRAKVFENYDEAVRTSTHANRNAKALNAAGRRVDIPAVLAPNYDVLANFDGYISRYANALAQNAWRTEALATFGRKLDSFDSAAEAFDLLNAASATLSRADTFRLAKFFTLKDRKVASFGRVSFNKLLEKTPGHSRRAQEANLMHATRATLNSLNPQGKRAMIARLLHGVESESQLNVLTRDLDSYLNYFPSRLHSEGEIASQSYAKLYGEHANMVKVQSGGLTGGKPYLLPRAIYDDLTRIDADWLRGSKAKELHGLVRAYDKVTSLARLGVYTAWLPSAVRDSYNNVILSMFDTGLAALSPSKYKHAVGLLAGRKGSMRTVTGETWSYDELRQLAETMGVRVPGRVFAEGIATERGVIGRKLAVFADKRGNIENAARLQLWLTNIERGISPQEAARHVTEFLFDYGEVSPFFRSILRRAFFFPTFTMKNVPFWARELRRNPGLAINQLKPFRTRHEERTALADWQADQLRFRLDRDGRTLHVLSGIDLPISNLDTLWPGVGKTFRRYASMLAPVPRVVLEQVGGTNLLTGRPMSRTQSQSIGRIIEALPTPKGVKDALGYRKELDAAGRPSYSFDERSFALLVRSWMFSRVVSSSDRVFRDMVENADKSTLQAAIESFGLGIRYNTIDLDAATEAKLKSRVAALREALQRRGFRVKKPGELE